MATIPAEWILILNRGNKVGEEVVTKYDLLDRYVSISNYVCAALISTGIHPMITINKWEEILDIFIDVERFYQLFKNIYIYTLSTKLRDFQYRFILLRIYTNVDLKNWKQRTDNCTFCGIESETILHLFVDCHKVEAFGRENSWFNI